MRIGTVLAIVMLATLSSSAQTPSLQLSIQKKYDEALVAMHNAKTKADIENAVDRMDVPEWVANLPDGTTMTRPQSQEMLLGLLAVPPEKRPTVSQHIIYLNKTGWNILVVYWVFRPSTDGLVGSLARDTWVETSQGLRRIRHEKLFPDRPLIEQGKPVVLPVN